ncbi:MAG: 3-oxoacyl-[acyl-carrier-protein] reductase [Christensenellales bacterium]
MLTGKVAVITGGSRGIGRAVAIKLSQLGAQIALLYAGNETAAAETLAAIETKARAYRADVSDFNKTKETVAAIRAEFGAIDILVNNAGITDDALLLTMREDAFDRVIDTNLKGAFHMIRHISPIMLRQKSGKIINVSSVTGIMGNAGQANYAASKAGLIGLTKTAARELAPRGITCNAVAPGFIDTDMTKSLTGAEHLLSRIPMGRAGAPEDVAELIAFLAGRGGDYITGEVIRIDGGMAM